MKKSIDQELLDRLLNKRYKSFLLTEKCKKKISNHELKISAKKPGLIMQFYFISDFPNIRGCSYEPLYFE